jgi:hypothetical protein
VTIVTETLAEIALDGKVRLLGANDAARSSFTAQVGDSLIALDPGLDVLGRWPVDPQHRGHHATRPDRGLALISGASEVCLVDHTGRVCWRYVDPSGSKIITTPHMGGPLLVRSFPSLEIVRSIEPPPGESWIESAFFAGEMIIGGLGAQEDRFVAISQDGAITDLKQPEARYLVPANHGTWMAVTQTTIRRCRMTGRKEEIPAQSPDEEIPGQMALW